MANPNLVNVGGVWYRRTANAAWPFHKSHQLAVFPEGLEEMDHTTRQTVGWKVVCTECKLKLWNRPEQISSSCGASTDNDTNIAVKCKAR